MHLNGPNFPYIDGKEQGERAIAFAVLDNQNKNGNAAFATDGTRYAVGFSAVEPTASAQNVNLDADGLAAYQYMIQNQCTVYYRGTATWVGNQNGGWGHRRRERNGHRGRVREDPDDGQLRLLLQALQSRRAPGRAARDELDQLRQPGQ
jgi:hypothetical protein